MALRRRRGYKERIGITPLTSPHRGGRRLVRLPLDGGRAFAQSFRWRGKISTLQDIHSSVLLSIPGCFFLEGFIHCFVSHKGQTGEGRSKRSAFFYPIWPFERNQTCGNSLQEKTTYSGYPTDNSLNRSPPPFLVCSLFPTGGTRSKWQGALLKPLGSNCNQIPRRRHTGKNRVTPLWEEC